MIGLKRDVIDKFYTKNSVVDDCLKYVKKYINITNEDLVIEPSAGGGAFISSIKSLTNNYLFYDLEPENSEIKKQDFLLSDEDYKIAGKIHIIGNPPFGRQSSLAIKFIKKSCGFCDTLSFILPKSFKKDSLKKKVPKKFHLLFEIDLPERSFLVDGKEYNVPCIFQIWEKRLVDREEVKNLEPVNFIFVKKSENPDIAFRRVGDKAGMISTDFQDKSIQSHYFIKFSKKFDVNKLKNIKFESNNTVGPKSISKQELIYQYNQIIN